MSSRGKSEPRIQIHVSWRWTHDLPMTTSEVLPLERIMRESAIRLGRFENCILCKLTFCETDAKTFGNCSACPRYIRKTLYVIVSICPCILRSIWTYNVNQVVLCSLQTDATTIEGDRFHQLFSSSLVEPLEEDIMQELRGHVHCEFQVSDQSSSEHIRPRRRTAVNFRL